MKKFLCCLVFLTSCFLIFSNEYQIKDVTYNLEGCGAKIFGCTKEFVLNQQVPVDTKTVFQNRQELYNYIADYKQRLENTRAFSTLDVDISISEFPDEETNIYYVSIIVTAKDSFHLFAIPGPKFDSNSGLTLKLKLKDSNFLGTLTTLSSDIYFLFPTSSSDTTNTEFGFNCSFDIPFEAGIFNAVWFNSMGISYTTGDSYPEWDISSGLQYTLPFEKTALIFSFKQTAQYNLDFSAYNDELFFGENLGVSLPITLATIDYFGGLTYSPYINSNFYWDFNGISKQNTALSSPTLTAGHSISLGREDWNNNLRKGFSASLNNYYSYNFQRNIFSPILEFNSKAFTNVQLWDFPILDRIGFNEHIWAFTYLSNQNKNEYYNSTGIGIGGELRGIRNDQNYFVGGTDTNISSLTPTSAIILNVDFPIHLFTTNMKKGFLKHCNFEMQFSPFIDMALVDNKITKTKFNFKDGFYAAGAELLVYPTSWSGITIRGSIGFDIGRKFLSNYINTDWREDISNHEITLGFGLHY